MNMRGSIVEPVSHELNRIAGNAVIVGIPANSTLEELVSAEILLKIARYPFIPSVRRKSDGRVITTYVFLHVSRMEAVLGEKASAVPFSDTSELIFDNPCVCAFSNLMERLKIS